MMDFAVLIEEREKLVAELTEIDQEIRSVREEKRQIAIMRIRALMNTYDLSLDDLQA